MWPVGLVHPPHWLAKAQALQEALTQLAELELVEDLELKGQSRRQALLSALCLVELVPLVQAVNHQSAQTVQNQVQHLAL